MEIIIQKGLSCKRYAISKREDGFLSPQCSSRAWCFLSTKDGYLPYCCDCRAEEETAINYRLITRKYGEVDICNKYAKYIDGLNDYEMEYMGFIDLEMMRRTVFIERHEKPESEWYYMDYKELYIPPNCEAALPHPDSV